MATGIDHIMNTPQTAIGKGTVGEPPAAPAGKEGVTVRLFVIFDGTKNNRTNSAKRLNDPTGHFLKLKGAGSSYGNFYSNPAIHELMNKRRDRKKHEVSLYIEGIGTEDFSDEAQAAGLPDKKNGNDDILGNGFGAGSTGIREKVDRGVNKLREQIQGAYNPLKEYIEKIIVDVSGFSRGAAAARHFVYRREFLYGPWPDQPRPELVINFVGLYDTVSSFAHQGRSWPAFVGHFVRHGANTDKLFCDDVRELGLDMGDVPAQVVHLTAGDEHRQNFSLTNINTTLKVGKGVELRLPGVHSDIGGSYAERDPDNPAMDPSQPIRDLNQEVREVASRAEQHRLIEEGWYRPEQFQERPAAWTARALDNYGRALAAQDGVVVPNDPLPPRLRGARYLTNEYQYLTLRLMHRFALGQLGGTHEPLELADFADDRYVPYQVPPPLASLADHFESEAQARGRRPAARADEQHPNGTPPEALACRSKEETHWLRNRYLHRSAKQKGDFEALGMETRKDALRLVIPDDDPNFVPPSQRPKPVASARAVPAGER
ncbi:MAG TPA: DUF2235 domain-containing protein [Hymenobacter sp.]